MRLFTSFSCADCQQCFGKCPEKDEICPDVEVRNYEVRINKKGKKFVAWTEDYDIIIADKKDLEELATALGYKLIKVLD